MNRSYGWLGSAKQTLNRAGDYQRPQGWRGQEGGEGLARGETTLGGGYLSLHSLMGRASRLKDLNNDCAHFMHDVNDASSRGKEETWAGNSEGLQKNCEECRHPGELCEGQAGIGGPNCR